jgi:hypothetical protein
MLSLPAEMKAVQTQHDMTHPFWIALLEEWCRKRSGLTLPFLVHGTARHEGEPANPRLAADIIRHIRGNDQKDTYFRIQDCGYTGFPVIFIGHKGGDAGYKVFLEEKWGDTEAEQIENYLRQSETAIKSGFCSRVVDYPSFSWSVDFTPDEQKFIDSVSADYSPGRCGGVNADPIS